MIRALALAAAALIFVSCRQEPEVAAANEAAANVAAPAQGALANSLGETPPPELPSPGARVLDMAELLTVPQLNELSARSEALERQTTDQFAIVTVRALQGRTIEDYAAALGNHWRLGLSGRNNGVLLVVAPQERQVRIAVGEGLRQTLPDDEAQRIIDDLLPAFHESRWFDGIDRGSRAIIARLTAGAPRTAR